MLKEKILKALNKQINTELFSSYEYLAMSAYFKEENLDGFAHWFRIQSQEEYAHATKIYDYIHRANSKVTLEKIDAPKANWKNTLEVFEETYAHEQKVTKAIDEIVNLAIEEKDHATNNFLQWFVSEQVEEESTALNILEKVRLIGDNKNGLFLLDRELGQRSSTESQKNP